MTALEFRDYILKHMSAEDALLKLLESPILSYEELKFPEGKEQVHPLLIISMAAMDLGWNFAVEKETGSNTQMRGLAVGTDEYLSQWFSQKNKHNDTEQDSPSTESSS